MYDKDRWSREIIPFLDHYVAAMHKDERRELETKCTLICLQMEVTKISDSTFFLWLLFGDSSLELLPVKQLSPGLMWI